MVNRTVKKLKLELSEKSQSIGRLVRERDTLNEDLSAEKAKVEMLENDKRSKDALIDRHLGKMEAEVQWMRDLIEALTIDPKIVYAKTDRDIRQSKMELDLRRQERIDREAMNRLHSQDLGSQSIRYQDIAGNDYLTCKHGHKPSHCTMMSCKNY